MDRSDNFEGLNEGPVVDVKQQAVYEKIESWAWKAGYVGVAVGLGTFMALRYRVCQPHQYMVRTGLGIKDMAVSKSGFVYPFQKATILNMNPKTYTFDLHNMSKEKVEFKLPVSFTIGPMDPLTHLDSFKRYATTMNDLGQNELEKMIQSIIEGETRSLTATLTIEEMFQSKDKFREVVIDKIQSDFDREFGVRVHNGTIREMNDYNEKNRYFEYRKQRAIETANYESQVDVSRAKREGEIGTKEQEKQTRMSVSELEKDATLRENEFKQEIANSNALLIQAQETAKLKESLARIEATNEALKRQEEMEKEVEQRRAEHVLETMRANDLNVSKVATERKIVEAQGLARSIQLEADAHLYKATKEAEADLIKAQKNAEGILAVLNAQADGIRDLSSSADPTFLQFYLGLEKGLPQELARYHAETMKGLNPQVSIWNTGSHNHDSTLLPLVNMVQSIAPVIDGFQKHTGLKLPVDMVKPIDK